MAVQLEYLNHKLNTKYSITQINKILSSLEKKGQIFSFNFLPFSQDFEIFLFSFDLKLELNK